MRSEFFRSMIQLLRPKQWLKSCFVLAPLVFSKLFLDVQSIGLALYATALFSLSASCVYILNDLLDLEKDKLHPKKSIKRPLASGRVTKKHAWLLLFSVLVTVATALFFLQNVALAEVIAAYLILNLFYVYDLKHRVILDIFSIASGFVLRVLAGAVALDVPASEWIMISTFLLALFLASIKRQKELLAHGSKSRDVLQTYTENQLTSYIQFTGISSFTFYCLFVIFENKQLILTIPIVLYCMFRYIFLSENQGEGESPTELIYKDRPFQMALISWVIVCVVVLIG